MPAKQAIQPACRPMVSMTMTRRCDSAVVRMRSTASITMLMEVSNPKVKSVQSRSLSMVLGTPTTGNWKSSYSRFATPRVSSPPIATRASKPSRRNDSRSSATDSAFLYGLVRDDPRMVPPRAMISSVSIAFRGVVFPRIAPRQPSRNPWHSPPLLWMVRTTARITAFKAGQSPPPVSRATFMAASLLQESGKQGCMTGGLVTAYLAAGGLPTVGGRHSRSI